MCGTGRVTGCEWWGRGGLIFRQKLLLTRKNIVGLSYVIRFRHATKTSERLCDTQTVWTRLKVKVSPSVEYSQTANQFPPPDAQPPRQTDYSPNEMETFGKSNITVYHTKPSCMVNVNNQVSKQNFHFQIHIYKVNISPCCPQIERFKLFFVECDVKFNQLSSFSRFLFFSKLCPLLSLLCHQPQLLHQFIVFIIIINSIVFYEFLTIFFPLYTQ